LTTERLVTIVAGVVAVIAAFWFLALSPKLKQESDLQGQVTTLRASAEQAEQDATAGLQQRHSYHKSYATLVRLGKAVPADSDTPSLLTQVDGISNRAGTQLDGVTLSGDPSGATATTPPPATTTDPTAAATEATAALLPLGASVGPAGLSVMPYDVDFSGDYFQTAKLFGGLDGLVHLHKPKHSADTAEFSDPRPSGRLITINSFSLSTETSDATPTTALQGTLSMTTYLAPADQGLTGGATTTSPVPDGVTPTDAGSAPPVAATVTP
jgi:hypothetical protein